MGLGLGLGWAGTHEWLVWGWLKCEYRCLLGSGVGLGGLGQIIFREVNGRGEGVGEILENVSNHCVAFRKRNPLILQIQGIEVSHFLVCADTQWRDGKCKQT